MTFRDNRANSTKQNVKRERYSDMPLFTMIIMHALTAMFSWVSLGNHPILQLSTSCLSRTFSNVISVAESQSNMIHNNGEMRLFFVKWGPFQQFGPHEDQVLNWGPFRNHCLSPHPRLPPRFSHGTVAGTVSDPCGEASQHFPLNDCGGCVHCAVVHCSATCCFIEFVWLGTLL